MSTVKLYIPIEKVPTFKSFSESDLWVSDLWLSDFQSESHPCVFGFPNQVYKYQVEIFEISEPSLSKLIIDFYLKFVEEVYQSKDRYFYEVDGLVTEVSINE